MIEIEYDHSDRKAPAGFVKDLKLISSKFSALWDRFHHKWLIVSPAPVNVFRSGYVVERVVEKNGKYYPLNQIALDALAKSMRERGLSISRFIKGIEREIAEKGDKAEIKRLEMQREFEKEYYKLGHNKTVN